MFAKERRTLTIPDAFNPGSTVAARPRRQHDDATAWSAPTSSAISRPDWTLTLRGKVLHSENETNLMVDVADPFPIAVIGPPGPRQLRYVTDGQTITDPAQVANLNGNGLMTVQGLAFIDQPVTNGIVNLELAHQGARAQRHGRRLRERLQDAAEARAGGRLRRGRGQSATHPGGHARRRAATFIGLTPPDGFAGYNPGFWNLTNHTTIGALYLGDSWRATDRLTIDLGARARPQQQQRQERASRDPG